MGKTFGAKTVDRIEELCRNNKEIAIIAGIKEVKQLLELAEKLRNRIWEQELLIRELKKKEAVLTSMTNSWSWKVTAHLRKIGDFLRETSSKKKG